MNEITLRITLPAEQTDGLQQYLQQKGVSINPRDQMMAWNDALRADSAATGDETDQLVEAINNYLAQSGINHQVRQDHQEWALPQLQQFLQFAVDHFYWTDGRIDSAWWDGETDQWLSLVNQAQWLFQDLQEG